jgi:hypothetical protein
MKLETVVKLIKDKTNIFGFAKAKDIINTLKDNYESLEMRISIIREPDCKQSNKSIFENILIPLVKAKECMFRISLDTLYVYSRNMFRLRILDRACCLINGQLGDKYKFTVMTNYDIISEEHSKGELS